MTLLKMKTSDRFIANSSEIFQRYAVDLQLGYDFEEFRTLLAEELPERTLGAAFDPNIYPMDGSDAFWIVGRNTDGVIVHTQALRLVNLQGRSLGDHMTRGFKYFPPPVPGLNPSRSRFRSPPSLKRLFGSCCYDGEFWIAPGDNGLRGQGVSCVLARYGFFQAVQHWDPDIIMAFMSNSVVFKGFAERTGFMHTVPGAVRWAIDGAPNPVEGFLTYSTREDMQYLLELPLKDLFALAA